MNVDNNLLLIAIAGSAGAILIVLLIAILATRRRDRPEVTEQIAAMLNGIYDVTQRTSAQLTGIEASSTKESQLLHEPMSKAVQELQRDLAALQATAKQQHELEAQTASSMHKLEVVLAGAQSKGAAGENIIESLLFSLPAEWQVRDYQVGTFTVEFGMRLPNGLILPIDSKWVATGLLEQLENAEDTSTLVRLHAQIESAVRNQAKEVSKYVGSSTTANFGLLVLPNSVFETCRRAHIDVFSEFHVILVSQALLMPYLLLIYQSALSSAKTIDMVQLEGHIENTLQQLDQLQSDIIRIDRAVVSLRRTRDRMDGRVSQLRSSALSLQVDTATVEGPPQLAVVETQPQLDVAN
jgi:DNA recombination protein RmuC